MRKLVLNDIIKMRRQLYLELAKSYLRGDLKKILPKLPKILLPEGSHDKIRLFYEREVLKEKIKFPLGLDYLKVKEFDLYELVDFLDEIISGESELIEKSKFVDVIEKICSECPGGRFYVTDLCRNCIAHSCKNVCPKNAISIIDGRAVIDCSKSVSCGMCANVCPYHAIIKLERPCERTCYPHGLHPLDEGGMSIEYTECVACGACYIACPFGAIETPSQMLQVLHKLNSKDNLIAIYAPAAVAQFGRKISFAQFREGLKKIGFSEVFEVAIGADMVAEEEAKHLLEHGGLMLTSCCPAFVQFIKNKFPKLSDRISPVPSPMVMLAQKLRNDFPEHKIVFIGPCIAKKKEAQEVGIPDYVITFEEIAAMLDAFGVELLSLKGDEPKEATPYGWNFAHSGGVTEAVRYYVRKLAGDKAADELVLASANGLSECAKLLTQIESDKLKVDVLEGMGCDGGCIAGPGILVDPAVSRANLKKMLVKKQA